MLTLLVIGHQNNAGARPRAATSSTWMARAPTGAPPPDLQPTALPSAALPSSASLCRWLEILSGTSHAQKERADATVKGAQAPRRSLCCWLSGSSELQAELKLLNISNVGIHNLSPGMVTTELLMAGAAHALLALAAKAERWLKVPHNTDEAFIRLLILMPLGRTVTSCLCCPPVDQCRIALQTASFSGLLQVLGML